MKPFVSLEAHAKINLGLDVTGRRENGYHEVRMIMQTIALSDTLTLEQAEDSGIHLISDCPGLSDGEDNLVVKAIQLMKASFSIQEGVSVRLQKRIPISAGLAGGSADAAAALKGCNRLFGLSLTSRDLRELGLSLGADVPYCIMEGTALAEGIGEQLTPLPPLSPCFVLVAKPPFPVSTQDIYKAYDQAPSVSHPDIDGMLHSVRQGDLGMVIPLLGNVLEHITTEKYPIIEAIKACMKANGAANALMSGSGPSVFGLFMDKAEMEKCAESLGKNLPGLSVFPTTLYQPAGMIEKE